MYTNIDSTTLAGSLSSCPWMSICKTLMNHIKQRTHWSQECATFSYKSKNIVDETENMKILFYSIFNSNVIKVWFKKLNSVGKMSFISGSIMN